MAYNPNSPEALKRMMTLMEEIEGQTDRGVAIVGAAWIEDSMSAALEAFLQPDKKSWQRLFDAGGPLSSLSAKIDLCRLLGLTSNTIRSDLHIIRDIRNEFAHRIAHRTEHTKLSFESPHIKDKCMTIKCVAHEEITEPRIVFIRACAILYSDFEMHQYLGAKVSDGSQIVARLEH